MWLCVKYAVRYLVLCDGRKRVIKFYVREAIGYDGICKRSVRISCSL